MSSVSVESGKAQGGAGGASSGEDGMNDLYKVNQVWYRMLPTLSLVSKRTLLVNQSQSATYQSTNNSLIFNISTGEFYTAMSTSYLYLQLGWRGGTSTTPGARNYANVKALISQGNILSLIEEVIFTSASGTECERQTNKGLHSAIRFRYTNDQVYIDTIGQNQGAPYGPYFRIHDGATNVQGTIRGYDTVPAVDGTSTGAKVCREIGGYDAFNKPVSGGAAIGYFGYGCSANLNAYSTRCLANGTTPQDTVYASTVEYPSFVVPLDQVLGIFKPYMNCLFPAGLLSGGRLEIRWKSPLESVQFVGTMSGASPVPPATGDPNLANLINDSASAFSVQKAYLVFDAFQLQDNVLKRLNQTAAGPDGLSMLFDTYDHVITNFQGQGSCEAQVSQARSRVIRSWCAVRDVALINNPYVNSLATEAGVQRICAKIAEGSVACYAGTAITVGGLNSARATGSGGISQAVVTFNRGDMAGSFGLATIPLQPPLPADNIAAGTYGKPTVSSFQSQLGSLFFPQQPLTTLREQYQNALYIFGMGIPDSRINCSVTLEDFKGGLGVGLFNNGQNIDLSSSDTQGTWVYPYGLAIYGSLMEKSQALQLSGLPLSNARLLRHKFTFPYAPPSGATGTRQISTFTEFTRVAKTFLGGRVVVRE